MKQRGNWSSLSPSETQKDSSTLKICVADSGGGDGDCGEGGEGGGGAGGGGGGETRMKSPDLRPETHRVTADFLSDFISGQKVRNLLLIVRAERGD